MCKSQLAELAYLALIRKKCSRFKIRERRCDFAFV